MDFINLLAGTQTNGQDDEDDGAGLDPAFVRQMREMMGDMSQEMDPATMIRPRFLQHSRNSKMRDRVKCPVCIKAHRPVEQGMKGACRYVSHHALEVFVSAPCPICLEDCVPPPNIALPCGHVICTQDFQQIGGTVLPRSETDNDADDDDDDDDEEGQVSLANPEFRAFLEAQGITPPPIPTPTQPNAAPTRAAPPARGNDDGSQASMPHLEEDSDDDDGSNGSEESIPGLVNRTAHNDPDSDDDDDDSAVGGSSTGGDSDSMPPLFTREEESDSDDDGSDGSEESMPNLVNRTAHNDTDDDDDNSAVGGSSTGGDSDSMPPLFTREEESDSDDESSDGIPPLASRHSAVDEEDDCDSDDSSAASIPSLSNRSSESVWTDTCCFLQRTDVTDGTVTVLQTNHIGSSSVAGDLPRNSRVLAATDGFMIWKQSNGQATVSGHDRRGQVQRFLYTVPTHVSKVLSDGMSGIWTVGDDPNDQSTKILSHYSPRHPDGRAVRRIPPQSVAIQGADGTIYIHVKSGNGDTPEGLWFFRTSGQKHVRRGTDIDGSGAIMAPDGNGAVWIMQERNGQVTLSRARYNDSPDTQHSWPLECDLTPHTKLICCNHANNNNSFGNNQSQGVYIHTRRNNQWVIFKFKNSVLEHLKDIPKEAKIVADTEGNAWILQKERNSSTRKLFKIKSNGTVSLVSNDQPPGTQIVGSYYST